MSKKIEKYLDFTFGKVFDALQNPVDITWEEKDNVIFGTFFINEREYSIKIVLIKKNVFKFKFYSKTIEGDFSTKMAGLKTDVYKVIPTIKNAMIYLIENYKPNGIIFAAMNDSDTRKTMYQAFSEELSGKYSYKQFIKEIDNAFVFLLYKKLTEKDIENILISGREDLNS